MTPTLSPTSEPTREPLEPTMPRERTPADVLLAAARYIEEHGWAQGQMTDYETGRVCILGAVYSIAHGDRAGEALAPLYRRFGSVVDWQDTPGRTEAEVIAALRAAAGAS